MPITIDMVAVGKVVPLGAKGVPSGIFKMPVPGPWIVEVGGIAGDAQGDTIRHGGIEKAIHHYPQEHYAVWRKENPALDDTLLENFSFGENFSTQGISESDICVGDVYQVGSAKLQVSQGRQPCWKLNLRFDVEDMAYRVQSTGRTGWYYRILEAGIINKGDCMTLVERPRPRWSIERLIQVLYHSTEESAALSEMATVKELSKSWRNLAARRLLTGRIESWSARLTNRT